MGFDSALQGTRTLTNDQLAELEEAITLVSLLGALSWRA